MGIFSPIIKLSKETFSRLRDRSHIVYFSSDFFCAGTIFIPLWKDLLKAIIFVNNKNTIVLNRYGSSRRAKEYKEKTWNYFYRGIDVSLKMDKVKNHE